MMSTIQLSNQMKGRKVRKEENNSRAYRKKSEYSDGNKF